MKLPDIEFGAPVQDPGVGALRLVDDAQRRAASTLQAGFQAFGQEMVKTQTNKAAADLTEGLTALEAELNSRSSVSTDWVRQQLGDQADALLESAGVRDQLRKTTLDPVTGEPVTVERKEVPTWVVAGAIYDKRARELLRGASSNISMGEGWQAAFQEAAGPDVSRAKAKFAAAQLDAMHRTLKLEQGATVDALVRLGKFGRAISLVEDSRAWDQGEKEALREKILGIEQDFTWKADAQTIARDVVSKSLFEGSRRVDPGAAEANLEKALEGKPAQFRLLARGELDHALKRAEAITVAELGNMAAGALQEFQAPGPDGKPLFSTSNISPERRRWLTDPKNGRDAAEYWHTLLSWENSARRAARGDRLIPTDEQARNEVELDADMRARPEAYRGREAVLGFIDKWLPTKGDGEPPLSLQGYQRLSELLARLQEPTAGVQVSPYKPMVSEVAVASGLLPADKNDRSAQQLEALRELERRTEVFVNQQTQLLKRTPDPSLVRGFVEDQMKTEEIKRRLWFDTKRTSLTPEPVTTRGVQPGPQLEPRRTGAQPKLGDQVPSEALGYPPGGTFEMQANGSWKRVK